MLRRLALLAGVLVLVASSARAQSIGAGTQSCGQFVEARRTKSTENTLRSYMMLSWVQGYLVGVAETTAAERTSEELAGLVVEGKISPTLPDDEIRAYRQKKYETLTGWAFDIPDSDAVKVWIDKYCAARPLNLIKQAAGELADELEISNKPVGPPMP
jgi:hypothetical protein